MEKDTIKIIIKTKYEKLITAKDSTGAASTYELSTTVKFDIQLNDKNKSFLNEEDFKWFQQHPLDASLDYFKASKKYSKERNIELFELIEKGSEISKGELFTAISQLIQ